MPIEQQQQQPQEIGVCVPPRIFHLSMTPHVHRMLKLAGVPDECLPSTAAITYSSLVAAILLAFYFVQWRRRILLSRKLVEAEERVRYLKEKLLLDDPDHHKQKKRKDIRIFMDGAFDMLHYGHMNAFRLARSLGTHLVVGVNSDISITECKGEPLQNDRERLEMVKSCKFVDEVIPECPYVMSREYIDYVISKYNIDYVVHGDDPCFVDGKDVYEAAKEAKKFRTIPRTVGVSTTEIIGRMLLMSKEHHLLNHNNDDGDDDNSRSSSSSVALSNGSTESTAGSDPSSLLFQKNTSTVLGNQSKFLTTSRMLKLFSADVKAPANGSHVVYIDGAWDLFHPGHVSILRAARERGDYLIVGVHGDAVVNSVRGMNLPLMNLHERVLSVLGCRYVDDVLIDAPYEISPEMLAHLNISEVVRSTTSSDLGGSDASDSRYRYARELGIFTLIENNINAFSLASIVQRIQRNQEAFQAKFEKKREKEASFYEEKYKQQTSSNNGHR